jgi:hypothetical protein
MRSPPFVPTALEKVIAVGAELEKIGPVTPTSLHEALGGRGARATAFPTWETGWSQAGYTRCVHRSSWTAASLRREKPTMVSISGLIASRSSSVAARCCSNQISF